MKKILKNKMARKTIREIGSKSYNSNLRDNKKLNILKDVSKNGKIFGVEFVKKNGDLRVMSCRKGVTKHLKGGENSVAHIPKYVTVFSCNDQGYRNVNLQTIKTIKGSGKVYHF